ncbi:MAG TPA: CpaF/VirB11 family protein, partial [Candidatus Limnocylindrales bacterium]|nr:CpaF/VirB11 family protein [Candidatus Limnocylindrales bacterium]
MFDFLKACVEARLNIFVSGGTGSGKTTELNILSSFIPNDERIVTIEDAAELQLRQEHVVTMESRPANIEGKGAIPIRELVRNSLRMRPDRIIVGECRSGEALDMLQAMNTGHDGSMSTGYANSPRDMLARLETMVLMAGVDLPFARHPRADRLSGRPDRASEPPQGRHPQDHQHHRGPGYGRRRHRHVGRLRLRADRGRRGQDPGPAEADRDPSQVLREVRGHGHPPPARPLRLQLLEGETMDFMTIGVAVVAAVAVLLIFFGVFGGRSGDVNERLERYAAEQHEASTAATKGERASLGSKLSGSSAAASFNRVVERRDWAANMARELARADLVLKPSEWLAIRIGVLLGVPALVFILGATVVPALSNPIAYVVGVVLGFWIPRFWHNRRKGKRLKAFNTGLADTIT